MTGNTQAERSVPQPVRLMGLDYGSVTVGVAVTDELGITAIPLETVTRKKENHLRQTLKRIAELAEAHRTELIVLGRPVHMDGSAGERVAMAENFRTMLAGRIDVPIIWQDERLTTVEADEILAGSGIPKADRKKYLDSVAASVILRDYMNMTESICMNQAAEEKNGREG